MTDRRVSAAARSAAAVVLFGLSASALGAGYASGISESGGNITFTLNENNSNVTVIRDGVPTSLGALNLGSHTFARNGAASYSIVVTTNNGDGFLAVNGLTSGTPGFPDGTLTGTPLQISDDNNVRNAFNSPRGIAVNTKPGTGDLFGRVYVANSANGSTAGFPILIPRTLTDGIYVNDAAGGDPLAQADNALTAGINVGVSTNSPFRVSLDDAGALYIADWSDAGGTLFRTDPNVTTGGNLFVGVGSATPIAPTTTLNHGSVAAAFIVGSVAGGNAVVYTIDEDMSPDGNPVGLNGLWRYNVGGTSLGFNGIPDQLNNTALIDNFAAGGIYVDMTRGPDGKFYMAQFRADGNESGIAIVDPSGQNVIYRSLADSQFLGIDGNTGVDGIQDNFRNLRGIEVSPDGRYLAAQLNNSDVMVVPLIDGIPDIANRILLDAFDNVASGRDMAFDAANNLYALTSGNQALRVFSPGGPSETTYNSNGTFRARTEPDFNGTGNYSDGTKWLLGVVPNAGDAYATVGNLSTGAQTLTIDAPTSLGRLRFAGGNYTVGGTSTVTMGAGFSEPRIIAEAGNHTVNAPLSVQKNLGVAAYTGASLTLTNVSYASNTLNLTKFGGGRVTLPAAEFNRVDVRNGTLAIPNGAIKTTALRVEGAGSALDVGAGGLIVDYTDTSPAATIQSLLTSGYAAGAWTGDGINSSTAAAAASGTRAVGFGEASELNITNFFGQPVDASAVLVRYTRAGDANLDGTTNIGDFSILASNFNQSGSWSKGDFNYDGQVNIADFSQLAANFNLTAADGARPGAVPEPAALSLLAVGAAGLLRRRRA